VLRVHDYTITARPTETALKRFAMKKKIPKFNSEDEERDFWATHDSTEYVDWKKAKRIRFPKLKPSTKTTSVRLPESMLDDLKILANKRDVPYQSLLKIYLAERIRQELGH
jgi:predicted DNA binding CopG/RHH family protein